MLATFALGLLIGAFVGYRIGMWHVLKRLGSAELKNRLGNIRANRLGKK